MSASVLPVKFWKPGTTPDGIPVSRIATRSARSAGQHRRGSGTRPGTAPAAAVASSGCFTYCANCLVAARVGRVPQVLLAERDDHLVEQRVAEPRDLHPRADLRCPLSLRMPIGLVEPSSTGRLAARAAPDAEHRLRARRVGRHLAVPRQLRDRDLDRDRVHVQRARAGRRSTAAADGIRCRFWNGRRSARSKIDAEVDEERVVPLAGEHRLAASAACAPRPGRAPRSSASSAGRCCTAATRRLLPSTLVRWRPVDPRDVVELALVPVRIVERGDRPGVVEERVRVPQLGA